MGRTHDALMRAEREHSSTGGGAQGALAALAVSSFSESASGPAR